MGTEGGSLRKFRSIPTNITAWKVGERPPDNIKTRYFEGSYQVWNERGQAWISFKHGDYICVDDPKDMYPIPADVMAKKYVEIENG